MPKARGPPPGETASATGAATGKKRAAEETDSAAGAPAAGAAADKDAKGAKGAKGAKDAKDAKGGAAVGAKPPRKRQRRNNISWNDIKVVQNLIERCVQQYSESFACVCVCVCIF